MPTYTYLVFYASEPPWWRDELWRSLAACFRYVPEMYAMGNFLKERGNLKKTEKREPDAMLHIAWRPLCVITERIKLSHRFSRPF